VQPQLGITVNVIEAFDQPWKRSFEGAMGAGWGLFGATGAQRVHLSGEVPGNPRAAWWLGALVLATVLGAFSSLRLALACGVLAGLAALQWDMSIAWDRKPLEFAVSAALAALGALAVAAFSVERAPAALRRTCHLALMFAAASAALSLLLDPRYRPLPWWWFAAPVWAIWVARFSGGLPPASARLRFLALALAMATLGFMLREGWQNTQGWIYGAVLLALSGTALPSRTSDTPASSSAGAAH
jgi:hypothetical protein